MFQNQLLKHLQSELPAGTSLNEAVATALDISYDAAHRRTSFKSKFSLDESILLARYYNLSLDRLFETNTRHIIAVEKTKPIRSEEGLKNYFEDSYQSLRPLLDQKKCRILYSAKDIPLFYTLDNDLISRFKMYAWLKLLDPQMESKDFESFSPRIETLEAAKALGSLYGDLNTTEIWDITTVNSTLKQIHFYNQAGHVSNQSALRLCKDLKQLIERISKRVTADNRNYLFYYNELLLMNNSVFVSTPNQQSLFVPFSILSYYQSSDKTTCRQAKEYLDKQLQSSKLLNASGEKEKLTFFNKIYSKIDALHQLIEATQVLDFE